MKRITVLLGLALALVGCRDNGAQVPPQVAGDAATASTVSQPAAAEPAPAVATSAANCPAGSKTENPLPALGLQINVPCGLRSERDYQTAAGAARKQVTFEYLEATPNDALNAIRTTLEASGFRVVEQPTAQSDVAGVMAMKVAKGGFGTAKVWANPNPKAKIKNPVAHGAIGIDFPVQSAQ
jgi:hypothetical protein